MVSGMFDCIPNRSAPHPLDPPTDYFKQDPEPVSCAERLGLPYLISFRERRAQYCSTKSPSRLICFHNQIASDRRVDSFCVRQNAMLSSGKFQLACEITAPQEIESNHKAPDLESLPPYWYDTGPRQVFRDFIELDAGIKHSAALGATAVLVKREGPGNLWHSLMEIMSLSMTLDVLQMTRSMETIRPIISTDDAPETQIVILDKYPDGPYFDLWRLFARMPVVRLSDLPDNVNYNQIVVPLPGGSNPVWESDWEPNLCQHSELLVTFARRVIQHFNISNPTDSDADDLPEKVVVTIINRTGTRKLIDQDKHIEALRQRYPSAQVLFQVIDFASIPFSKQIEIIRTTDVLVGVHGAGLTHGLWLIKGSTMVEILPEGLHHKGFRNLAGALGHNYFSTHASGVGAGRRRTSVNVNSWQAADVALEERHWLELMDVAIKSQFNKGQHNMDAIK